MTARLRVLMKIPRVVAACGRLSVVAVAPFVATIAVSASEPGSASFQDRRTWHFAEDGVAFSNEFSGARLNGVERTDARRRILARDLLHDDDR